MANYRIYVPPMPTADPENGLVALSAAALWIRVPIERLAALVLAGEVKGNAQGISPDELFRLRRLRPDIEPGRLQRSRHDFLELLAGWGGRATRGDLQAASGVTKGSIRMTLNLLVESGHIQETADPEEIKPLDVQLTAQGWQYLERYSQKLLA